MMEKKMMNLIAKIGEKMAESAANSASWPFCYQSSEPDGLTEFVHNCNKNEK